MSSRRADALPQARIFCGGVVFIEVWMSSVHLDYNAEWNRERTGTAHQSHPPVGYPTSSVEAVDGGAHPRSTRWSPVIE
jgi:hypothetical protein